VNFVADVHSMRGTTPHTSKLTLFVRRGGQWLNSGWQLAPETTSGGAVRPGPGQE
jgi:hypothetical protein